MDYTTLIVNILVGTLIPSVVLWLIGKKVQYDFHFGQLLIITFCAATVKQIPNFGLWISLPVYYGLFCGITGIDYIEAVWMSFLAFLVYAAAGFILLMVAGSLFAGSSPYVPDQEQAPLPVEQQPLQDANTNTTMNPQQDIQPEPPKEEPPQPDPLVSAELPDRIRKKYTLTGIAELGNEKRALINGLVFAEGQMLEQGLIIHRIRDQCIILLDGKKRYEMVIPSPGTE